MQDYSLLVRQTLAGDEDAFCRLVREHYGSVFAQILSMVHNSSDAEELTNDVFIKAYLNLSRLRKPSRFHGWLHRIARNHCQDWLRKHRDRCLYLEELSDEASYQQNLIDSRLLRQEQIDRTLEAIESLPRMDRDLMRDFYLDDLSYSSLQERYSLSEASVRMRLLRARQKIRQRVKDLFPSIAALRWRKALIGGGLEVMKLGVKTKLMVAGAIVLGGISILTWRAIDQPASEQNQMAVTAVQATEQPGTSVVKTASLATEDSAGEVSGVSQKEIEEAIAFLDKLGQANDPGAVNDGEDIDRSDSVGKGKLSPELKWKTEQYAKLAAILPQLREVKQRVGRLCEENRNYAERRDSLRGTPDAIPEAEESRFFAESDRKIRAGIAEEKVYYAKIDDMFPDLELYEEWYDDTLEEWNREQYAFHGMRLVEYFGKKLPWDGNADYLNAEPWDGIPDWRPD
jgi:RNA polymerase sigma factor (sigma-70 family)